jgi:hypothetical protein
VKSSQKARLFRPNRKVQKNRIQQSWHNAMLEGIIWWEETSNIMKRKLLMGMVDGSISTTHRIAVGMDRKIEYVAGVFSLNPEEAYGLG